MEFGSGGGSGSGDYNHHNDGADRRSTNKKHYHRHTAHQIQRLEATFKESPHPDEKTRMMLSRELGLTPRQIKFWFQNRRTQMKAQYERQDNCTLRAENDRFRCENIAMREALKHVICPSCGGPPVTEDSYFDEQKLRMENVQLKEELDRVSSIAAKYIGRPISQLPPVQPVHVSSLELSMGSFRDHGMPSGPSLGLDFPGTSTMGIPQLTFPTMRISDMDKSLMVDIAHSATEELLMLLQTNEPLWMKSTTTGREILNLESYERIFPRANTQLKNPGARIEASRESGLVIMNSIALVDMFMDANKFVELFPTIVSRARTIEVIASPGMLGSPSGTLQLMHQELQVLSPFVPERQFYILRYCQQIEQDSWTVVDVSYDILQDNQSNTHCKARRLPSGCLIQDMPNGYSKVTWVEHSEVEYISPIHRLFRDLVVNGISFGAERWLATLQRMCERLACLMVSRDSAHDLGGVIPSPEGKRSMRKLAQRMVTNFCASMNPSNGQQWTTLSGLNEFEVRATLHENSDPGQPSGVALTAATTIWLPVSPQNVFGFFRDEQNRPQWDVLSNKNPVQDIAHIANGSDPGNCISVLRASNTSQNNMLILQESCIDASGSLVVYCPVDLNSINIAMSGDDPSCIPLLPSGFTISPDGRKPESGAAAGGAAEGPGTSTSSSSNAATSLSSGGSLVTVVFQILVSSLPYAKMSHESISTISNLISNTVHLIKASLNDSSDS